MNIAEIDKVRANACRLMAGLGALLDSLQLVEDIVLNPMSPYADACITEQHLDEAAREADATAQHATDLAVALDGAAQRIKEHRQKLENQPSPEDAA